MSNTNTAAVSGVSEAQLNSFNNFLTLEYIGTKYYFRNTRLKNLGKTEVLGVLGILKLGIHQNLNY